MHLLISKHCAELREVVGTLHCRARGPWAHSNTGADYNQLLELAVVGNRLRKVSYTCLCPLFMVQPFSVPQNSWEW